MKHSILFLIQEYLRTGNETYFEELLERFSPLIKSYAKKLYYLNYEDSVQELSIALYEAVSKISAPSNEYACISYISNSIFNKFTKLYRQSVKAQSIQTNSIPWEDIANNIYSHHKEIENCIALTDLRMLLKTKSRTERIISYLLLLGYSDKEIAKILGYTRQYVNRIKKKIITD